jgi:glutamate dehydrogenase/leucine dehydrogenase
VDDLKSLAAAMTYRPATERRLRSVLSGVTAATTGRRPPPRSPPRGSGEVRWHCAAALAAASQRVSLELDGKVVVITGASKGIGAAVARQFAAEGAHVHLVSRTEADLRQLQAELAVAHPASRCDVHAVDLAAPGGVAKLWSELDDSGGGAVDILVNNAGAIPAGDLLTVDEVSGWAHW